MFNQQQQFHCSTRNNKNISHKKTSQYLSCVQPEANVFYMFHQRNKKPQICSHIKTESKIFHNGADTQDWLRNTQGPNQRICLSSQGQVYAMKQYLQNKRLAIFVLFCTLPTYCWPSYCSYVPFFGHYWHFCVFWFPKKLSLQEINIFKEVWFYFFLNL